MHDYFSDHLGSHGVVENATGSACEQDVDYYPYGGEESENCTTPVAQNYKFTGKERDTESGLDNFGARYNASNLGRFMTPDWAAKPVTVPYAKFGDPQTLNLYAYTENGPVNRVDADGHNFIDPGGPAIFPYGSDVPFPEQPPSQELQKPIIVPPIIVDVNDVVDDVKSNLRLLRKWWRRSILDKWKQRIAAHQAPPQKPSNLQVLQDINNLMMGVWCCRYSNTTGKSALATDITTDLTPEEFGANLEAEGYTKSQNGDTTQYTKGDMTYSVYPKSGSTGGPTAQGIEDGKTIVKIRLQ